MEWEEKGVDSGEDQLVVLTTADADLAVMAAFAGRLERLANTIGRNVLWRVVDGLKAYEGPPTALAGLAIALDWVTPEQPLTQAAAIVHGFALSRQRTVIMMAPDMLDNVDDIPAFLARNAEGYEIVAAWRVSRPGVPFLRRVMTVSLNHVMKVLFRLPVHDFNTGMALLSPSAMNHLLSAPPRCPAPELFLACSFRAFTSEVPVVMGEIPGKKSAYSVPMRIWLGILRLGQIIGFLVWQAASGRK